MIQLSWLFEEYHTNWRLPLIWPNTSFWRVTQDSRPGESPLHPLPVTRIKSERKSQSGLAYRAPSARKNDPRPGVPGCGFAGRCYGVLDSGAQLPLDWQMAEMGGNEPLPPWLLWSRKCFRQSRRRGAEGPRSGSGSSGRRPLPGQPGSAHGRPPYSRGRRAGAGPVERTEDAGLCKLHDSQALLHPAL